MPLGLPDGTLYRQIKGIIHKMSRWIFPASKTYKGNATLCITECVPLFPFAVNLQSYIDAAKNAANKTESTLLQIQIVKRPAKFLFFADKYVISTWSYKPNEITENIEVTVPEDIFGNSTENNTKPAPSLITSQKAVPIVIIDTAVAIWTYLKTIKWLPLVLIFLSSLCVGNLIMKVTQKKTVWGIAAEAFKKLTSPFTLIGIAAVATMAYLIMKEAKRKGE